MLHKRKHKQYRVILASIIGLLLLVGIVTPTALADSRLAYVASDTTAASKNYCGGGKDKDGHDYPRVETAIDFGCKGKGNALTDMAFAIIRWLSDGVGIVVVASLIVGGVQYSAAGGDPNATQAAIKRMRSAVTALLVFIFAYAILNYVLPGAFLK